MKENDINAIDTLALNFEKLAKFKAKKMQSEILFYNLKRLGLNNRAEKIKECGTYLTIGIAQGNKKHLIGANFCRDRLCPLCAWRKSATDFFKLSRGLDIVLSDTTLRALFLTLTIKNTKGNNLKRTLEDMSSAWNRLNSSLKKKNFVLGFYKATEITYNENSKTFHPHFHVVLIVKDSYFTSADYIPQIKWRAMWKKSLKLDYAPLVNIQAVDRGENQNKAILEVSKYAVKSADYIHDIEVIDTLTWAINGKRFVATGGLIKQAIATVKEQATTEVRETVYTAVMHFQWFHGFREYGRFYPKEDNETA